MVTPPFQSSLITLPAAASARAPRRARLDSNTACRCCGITANRSRRSTAVVATTPTVVLMIVFVLTGGGGGENNVSAIDGTDQEKVPAAGSLIPIGTVSRGSGIAICPVF